RAAVDASGALPVAAPGVRAAGAVMARAGVDTAGNATGVAGAAARAGEGAGAGAGASARGAAAIAGAGAGAGAWSSVFGCRTSPSNSDASAAAVVPGRAASGAGGGRV